MPQVFARIASWMCRPRLRSTRLVSATTNTVAAKSVHAMSGFGPTSFNVSNRPVPNRFGSAISDNHRRPEGPMRAACGIGCQVRVTAVPPTMSEWMVACPPTSAMRPWMPSLMPMRLRGTSLGSNPGPQSLMTTVQPLPVARAVTWAVPPGTCFATFRTASRVASAMFRVTLEGRLASSSTRSATGQPTFVTACSRALNRGETSRSRSEVPNPARDSSPSRSTSSRVISPRPLATCWNRCRRVSWTRRMFSRRVLSSSRVRRSTLRRRASSATLSSRSCSWACMVR